MGWRIDYWKALFLLIVYGGFIEISQLFAIHRSAEWGDLGADTLGALIGLKVDKYMRMILK